METMYLSYLIVWSLSVGLSTTIDLGYMLQTHCIVYFYFIYVSIIKFIQKYLCDVDQKF